MAVDHWNDETSGPRHHASSAPSQAPIAAQSLPATGPRSDPGEAPLETPWCETLTRDPPPRRRTPGLRPSAGTPGASVPYRQRPAPWAPVGVHTRTPGPAVPEGSTSVDVWRGWTGGLRKEAKNLSSRRPRRRLPRHVRTPSSGGLRRRPAVPGVRLRSSGSGTPGPGPESPPGPGTPAGPIRAGRGEGLTSSSRVPPHPRPCPVSRTSPRSTTPEKGRGPRGRAGDGTSTSREPDGPLKDPECPVVSSPTRPRRGPSPRPGSDTHRWSPQSQRGGVHRPPDRNLSVVEVACGHPRATLSRPRRFTCRA